MIKEHRPDSLFLIIVAMPKVNTALSMAQKNNICTLSIKAHLVSQTLRLITHLRYKPQFTEHVSKLLLG
jgi:hypothetical protein